MNDPAMTSVLVVIAAAAGAAVSSVLACVPGLHVYNVMGVVFALLHTLAARGIDIPIPLTVPFVAGLLVGYAVLNTVPSILLAAPDESALFTVLPGQKYVMQGRGYEATLLTTFGSVAGLFALVVGFGLFGPRLLPTARAVVQGHTHWILWCVISFMLMSEWPKGGTLGQAGWLRFIDGWKSTSAGLLTFVLSGILGFILLYRSPIATEVAFQNLLPAFVGLFTLPWLVLNILTHVSVPPQRLDMPCNVDRSTLAKGAFAGVLGGGFAAFFPVVTGGVGGLLAGHATAIRDDRVFLVSQGTSKLVYYVGAMLLLAVPGLGLTRGGGAWMLRGLYVPCSYYDFYMMLAAVAVGGAVSVSLVSPLTQRVIRLVERYGYRALSASAFLIVVGLVVGITGIRGLGVAIVATGIGLIPVLFGSRRMNCLGVILLPMACNMSGVGPTVAAWLGLV